MRVSPSCVLLTRSLPHRVRARHEEATNASFKSTGYGNGEGADEESHDMVSQDPHSRTLVRASAYSAPSDDFFLSMPPDNRPVRRQVPQPPVRIVGGGYSMAKKDVERFIKDNLAADAAYDAAMREWLRNHTWAVLRRYAKALVAQNASVRRLMADHITTPRDGGDYGFAIEGDEQQRVEQQRKDTRSARRKAAKRTPVWLRRSQEQWVPDARGWANGRPSLLATLPKLPSDRQRLKKVTSTGASARKVTKGHIHGHGFGGSNGAKKHGKKRVGGGGGHHRKTVPRVNQTSFKTGRRRSGAES